jgi:hypothetical protein
LPRHNPKGSFLKTHQVTFQVFAPDEATQEDVAGLIDSIVTIGQKERIADDDAPGLAAQINIGAAAATPITVMVGIEGGLVTMATASVPVQVIVADYDLAAYLNPEDSESRDVVTLSAGKDGARPGFVAIKHPALVEPSIIEELRAKMAEKEALQGPAPITIVLSSDEFESLYADGQSIDGESIVHSVPKGVDKHWVWSAVDRDGETQLVNGIHRLNNVGFVISAKPWQDGASISVDYEDHDKIVVFEKRYDRPFICSAHEAITRSRRGECKMFSIDVSWDIRHDQDWSGDWVVLADASSDWRCYAGPFSTCKAAQQYATNFHERSPTAAAFSVLKAECTLPA